LHAVVPPATPDGPIVAIRRFTQAVADLEGLIRVGSVSRSVADRLRMLVLDRRNVLVSGGTGTGKTTLLNVLSSLIPTSQRTVIIEDASELRVVGHRVRLEAQPPNAEGRGGVALDQLVRAALRLRPDRIVVGEVRGPEALDLVSALNTGHAGSMSTIHANGPDEALLRLETLALSGSRRPAPDAVRRQIEAAVDTVVQLARIDGVRRVVEIRDLR
jgi:pilus assembly protein CpaF